MTTCPPVRDERGYPVPTGGSTVKQNRYLWDLLCERPALADVENLHFDVVARMSFDDASYWIEHCLGVPKQPRETPVFEEVEQ